MPAKLILSRDGVELKEYVLEKERTTIGRKSHNDIVLDNSAVSNDHAAIITMINDSFLEDLESAKGLSVNGVATRHHFLQHNDEIEIGKFKLKYINAQSVPVTEANTAIQSPSTDRKNDIRPAGTIAGNRQEAEKSSLNAAAVRILSGSNTGKELELVKNLTTLGKPGVQVAAFARQPQGFFISHVEGAKIPLVNGDSIGEHPHQLNNHDIIDLAGVKMEFYFKV